MLNLNLKCPRCHAGVEIKSSRTTRSTVPVYNGYSVFGQVDPTKAPGELVGLEKVGQLQRAASFACRACGVWATTNLTRD
jgi:hypothetical protein